jgi:hypothetical protein
MLVAVALVLGLGGCGTDGRRGDDVLSPAGTSSAIADRAGGSLPQIRLGAGVVILTSADGIRALDATTGAQRWQTRTGRLSPDGRAAITVQDGPASVTVTVIDAVTGAPRRTLALDAGTAIAAMSHNGDRMAVIPRVEVDPSTSLPAGRASTRLQIVPTGASSTPPTTFVVPGNIVPEAFSVDAQALFVIEYLPAEHPDHYRVSAVDLQSGRVVDVFTRDKQPLDESMQGIGGAQTMSADGRWLFTVYREYGEHDETFIHALSLSGFGAADCLDLPADQGFGAGTVVAANEDGSSIVAVSRTGVLAEVDNTKRLVTRLTPIGAAAPSAAAVGRHRVAVGTPTAVVLLDRSPMSEPQRRNLTPAATALTWTGDGSQLVVSDGRVARYVDVATDAEVRVLGTA